MLAVGGARRPRSAARARLGHLVLFLIGAIAMRGAGCTYNDILDRKLDAGVERTRNRPLPSGRVRCAPRRSFLVAQALVGLAVLPASIGSRSGSASARSAIVAVYPLMKRVTAWPQAVLGLAFSWGALMGWARLSARLAPAAAPALRLGLLLDDRLRHDLRAAGRARRRDRRHPLDRAPVRRAASGSASALSISAQRLLAGSRPLAAGGGAVAQIGLCLYCPHLAWQIARIDAPTPATALALFRSNRDAGLILFAGFALEVMGAPASRAYA